MSVRWRLIAVLVALVSSLGAWRAPSPPPEVPDSGKLLWSFDTGG